MKMFLAGCSNLTIYGNDNMTSKKYAEDHKIPFEYIANWDKATSGSDVTAPAVTDILVTYASVQGYYNQNMFIVPAQVKLAINVVFSEAVQGTTVPTLTIKFGDGQNIQLTEGTVGDSTITYIYTVKNTDKGVMTTVDYKGGNIKDAAGNAAKLSCPALQVEIMGKYPVYANGTATNPSNSGTNNGGTTSGSTNNAGSSSTGTTNGTSNNKGTSSAKDNTVFSGKLPQTGIGLGLLTSLIVACGLGIFSFLKARKYKDI